MTIYQRFNMIAILHIARDATGDVRDRCLCFRLRNMVIAGDFIDHDAGIGVSIKDQVL